MNFFLILFLFLLNHCSFDDKTGIWKNTNFENETKKKFQEFEKISLSEQNFNEVIEADFGFNFETTKAISNNKWQDTFYSYNNNLQNFKYQNKNQVSFKSKKLSKYKINDYLFYENNLVINDDKGYLTVYSLESNNIIYKFNFYKKKYKNIKKKLKFISENNILYVIDNIGYIYSLDLNSKKLLWAKKFSVPFMKAK